MKTNNTKVLIAVMAVMFFSVIASAEQEKVRHFSGEIQQIDLKRGTIQLKSSVAPHVGKVTEYRINTNDTRVTDPSDTKFMTIADLQVGQHIMIDVIKGQEHKIVKKITADPYTTQATLYTAPATQTTVTTTTTTTR
jgi:hypothetical protein